LSHKNDLFSGREELKDEDYNQRYQDNTTEVVATKPRKVTAPTADFQQKFKTEICRNWEMSKCKFGSECTFAHGDHELMEKSHIPTNYRTKECKNFYSNLYCSYGNRCQFYHGEVPDHLKPVDKGSFCKSLNRLHKIRDRVLAANPETRMEADGAPASPGLKKKMAEELVLAVCDHVTSQMCGERLGSFQEVPLSKAMTIHSDRMNISSGEFRPSLRNSTSKLLGSNSKKRSVVSNSSWVTRRSKLKKQGSMLGGLSRSSLKVNSKAMGLKTNGDSFMPSTANYRYHDPSLVKYHYEIPVPQLPHI